MTKVSHGTCVTTPSGTENNMSRLCRSSLEVLLHPSPICVEDSYRLQKLVKGQSDCKFHQYMPFSQPSHK